MTAFIISIIVGLAEDFLGSGQSETTRFTVMKLGETGLSYDKGALRLLLSQSSATEPLRKTKTRPSASASLIYEPRG